MSELNDDFKTEEASNEANEIDVKSENKLEKSSKSFDINDQNELDYEEELDDGKESNDVKSINGNKNIKASNDDEESDDGAIDDDSDGEVKSNQNSDGELDDGEVVESNKEPEPPATPEEEEDGEINDGEQHKKAFIPRVLCKYYQRGKCTWGRTCKFLHPGVNDTGNYSFLEFQDPNAKVYQPQLPEVTETELKASKEAAEPEVQTESAWERGLRQAREMKAKAKQRKLAEKEQFADKKMNLSLKEFENEVENDERYLDIEKVPNADDEEDEDLHLFAQSGRLNNSVRGSGYNRSGDNNDRYMNRSYDNGYDSRRQGQYNDYRSRQSSDYRNDRAGGSNAYRDRSKADEWHDPWDRSRQNKKNNNRGRDRSNSYSSSGSDSRSRSHSRSSYSSSSSRSYSSSRSESSRSGSGSPSRSKKVDRKSRPDKKANSKLTNDLKKKIESLKNKKSLPGRQISDLSLKKARLDSEKSKKINKKTRSRSNSSMSSYGSSDSKSDDDDLSNASDSMSDENDDYDERRRDKRSSQGKKNLKQSGKNLKRAQEFKSGPDSKRTKTSASGDKAGSSDKKQMIKDQLKLLESALKKKSMAK